MTLALGWAGCASDVEDIGDDDDAFRIINGDPAPSTVAEYASTVGVHVRSGAQVSIDPFCSGTLITSDVVMTAAHCCDESNGGPNFNPMEPDEVAVYFGEGPAFIGNSVNGEFYGVSEVAIHPSFNKYSFNNDICLLRMEVVNPSVAPTPNLPASLGLSNADSGVLLDHAGFGYADLAKTEYGVKLHAEVPLAGLGCVVSGCPSPATNGQFSYEQDGSPDWGPCNGDSGGPAFIQRGGVTYVAGITSYGDAACSLYGVSTNVSAYQDFIDGFLGAPPPPAPDCSADGVCNAACDPGADPDCGGGGGCDSDGVCESGESCDGRGGTTACGDCPGVTSGRPSNRYCVVEGVCEGPGC
ncbi:MAG: trypsin-like serine protease [Nannocystaceae bacterium]